MKIHGNEYDISNFNHPGGLQILELCEHENDCTALFESYHTFCNKTKINVLLNKYLVKPCEPSKFIFNENGFYKTVSSRVVSFFKQKNNTSFSRNIVKAPLKWYITTLYLSLMFLTCQYQLLFGTVIYIRVICSLLSGVLLTCIGYNVLHDGSHYAISTIPSINICLSQFVQALLFLNHILWSYHHCIHHHQYTGNIKYDPDIINATPFFRKTNLFKKRRYEFTTFCLKTKILFFNFIFPGTMVGQSLSYLKWIINRRLWRMNLPKSFKIYDQVGQYIISMLFLSLMLAYGGAYIILHLFGTNIAYYIGSAPNHDLYSSHKEIEKMNLKKYENIDWGETQVRASSNFCTSYNFITRNLGGINYQIEHHLFPSVNNHHLKDISMIVKKTCSEFNIPYNVTESPLDVFKELYDTFYNVHQ